ncbi:MAG TPA: zf-HC2 domain-containing protein [Bryobacteraceae bacterium]|nr:zf-HC2 domain-containing protein [Bryobacteraceae bacterium]
MKCGRYEEWIALDAGGDLAPNDAQRLTRHLAECAACRESAEAMAAARTEFRTLADDQIDEADLAAVRRGVRARIAEQQTPRTAFGLRWVLAAATAAVALIAAILLAPERNNALPPPAIATQPNRAATVTERQHQPQPGATSYERTRATNAVSGLRQKRATASGTLQATGHEPRALQPAPSVVAVSPDVVRIQTPDPNVVVYWVLESKGNEEEARDAGDES